MRSVIGLLALTFVTWTLPSAVSAKTPGSEYCFHGTCHRVKTLEETRRLVGVTTTLKASFYDDPKNDRYNPSNITSSGEYFRSDKPDNAASPNYPDGTKLLVWHPASRKALTIRVNNAGPYWGDRKLDLSRAAADVFGFRKSGVATVQVRVLEAPSKSEATYKKGRTYASVKGYMGQFASLDAAISSTGTTRVASATTVTPKAQVPAAGLLDARALKSLEPAKTGATAVVANLPRRKGEPISFR
jgi:rare lipoprotein A